MATCIRKPQFQARFRSLRQISNPCRFYSDKPSSLLTTVLPLTGSKGHVLVLSLNRPEFRNALSRELVSSLSSTLKSIHKDGVMSQTRAVVISSNVNNAFCAGADLKERKTMSLSETRDFLSNLRSTLDLLEGLPVPSIAAVAGAALGGGLEMALCATLRVFSSSAVVGLPETRLAIIPGAGGTYRLPNLIGLTRARDMILTGRRISGPEAYFMGLCNRLVEVLPEKEDGSDNDALAIRAREKTLEEAVRLAVEISEGGPIATRQALEVIGKGREAEDAAYEKILETADRVEALQAFFEKRRPIYRGV